jgi:Outer membrane protein beta-barrel domain
MVKTFRIGHSALASFLLICILSITSMVYAFDLSTGFMIGGSVSDFWGKDKLGYPLQSRYRLETSALAEVSAAFDEYFGARMELCYLKKGKRFVVDYLSTGPDDKGVMNTYNSQWDETIKLDYIEIPLLAQVCILRSKKTSLSLYCGPAFDFLILARDDVLDNVTPIYSDIKDETNTFDFCGVAGLSCKRSLGPGGIKADLRFSGGFLTSSKVSLLQRSEDPTAVAADRKNWIIAVLIGYEIACK